MEMVCDCGGGVRKRVPAEPPLLTFSVTYLDQSGKELTTFVEAASVSADPHWVSFRSGSATGFNTGIIALFPAQRVRRVEPAIRES